MTNLGIPDYRYRLLPGCPESWDEAHCRCWYDGDGTDEGGAPDVVDLTP